MVNVQLKDRRQQTKDHRPKKKETTEDIENMEAWKYGNRQPLRHKGTEKMEMMNRGDERRREDEYSITNDQ